MPSRLRIRRVSALRPRLTDVEPLGRSRIPQLRAHEPGPLSGEITPPPKFTNRRADPLRPQLEDIESDSHPLEPTR